MKRRVLMSFSAKSSVGIFAAILLAVISSAQTYAAEPLFERADAFRGGADNYHTYRMPMLVCTKRGTLLLFCDGRKDHAGDLGTKIDPVMRRSVDGGKTWQPIQILFSDPGEKTKVGNACPIYDHETDTVHLIFLHSLTQAYLRSSHDDGVTFGAPVDITAAFREFNYPWVYVATGHVHGIQLRSGRLMAPVWVNDVPREQEQTGRIRNGIIYSDDHGRTWHAGGLVPFFNSLNESTVYEASDGSLVLNSRALRTGYRAVTRSMDQGKTWTQPELDRQLPDPTCQASTLVLTSGRGPHRLLFSNPANQQTRSHMTVRLSYDDGRTWPVSKLIDAGVSGYSDLAVGPDGVIYLAYERSDQHRWDRMTVVRFNLEWLTDGKDSLAGKKQ